MTPMIDVVFLLIIFFLVSSHLAQRENRIELELPTAAKGRDDIPNDSKLVTVNVTADGKLLVGGRDMTPEQLLRLFVQLAKEHAEEVEIRIRGDRNATYDKVSPIMKSAVDAGVWNVTFAVIDEPNR
jgi:biopolymer transport protein ExbD